MEPFLPFISFSAVYRSAKSKPFVPFVPLTSLIVAIFDEFSSETCFNDNFRLQSVSVPTATVWIFGAENQNETRQRALLDSREAMSNGLDEIWFDVTAIEYRAGLCSAIMPNNESSVGNSMEGFLLEKSMEMAVTFKCLRCEQRRRMLKRISWNLTRLILKELHSKVLILLFTAYFTQFCHRALSFVGSSVRKSIRLTLKTSLAMNESITDEDERQ